MLSGLFGHWVRVLQDTQIKHNRACVRESRLSSALEFSPGAQHSARGGARPKRALDVTRSIRHRVVGEILHAPRRHLQQNLNVLVRHHRDPSSPLPARRYAPWQTCRRSPILTHAHRRLLAAAAAARPTLPNPTPHERTVPAPAASVSSICARPKTVRPAAVDGWTRRVMTKATTAAGTSGAGAAASAVPMALWTLTWT